MKASPKLDPQFVVPTKGGDRRIAVIWLSNGGASVEDQEEHRAARVPVDGLAVRKQPIGFRPRGPSIAMVLAIRRNERWLLAAILSSYWVAFLSRSGKGYIADSALEHALIAASERWVVCLRQEFLTPHGPQQTG